jgi:hypothetical protein
LASKGRRAEGKAGEDGKREGGRKATPRIGRTLLEGRVERKNKLYRTRFERRVGRLSISDFERPL